VDALDLEVDVYSRDKKYSVDLRSCKDVLKDLGRFVIGALEQITIDEMALVVNAVSQDPRLSNHGCRGLSHRHRNLHQSYDFVILVLRMSFFSSN
jgi:hypothetical protein